MGTNFGLDVLGIPGTNGPDPRQSGQPRFAVSAMPGTCVRDPGAEELLSVAPEGATTRSRNSA